MPGYLRSSILVVIALATAPAWSQVYKWVDDKGVVNYSSEPPPARKSVLLDPNSASVSTYTPDQTLKRVAEPTARVNERILTERVASLERNLDAERYTRLSVADTQSRVLERQYEQCLRDRRVDCDYAGIDPYYSPYGPTVVVFRPHLRARPIVPIRPALAPKSSRPSFAPSRVSRLGARTM